MNNVDNFTPINFDEAAQLDFQYLVVSKCKRPRLQRAPTVIRRKRGEEDDRTLHKLIFTQEEMAIGDETHYCFREFMTDKHGNAIPYADWWQAQANKLYARTNVNGAEWIVKLETVHELRQLDAFSGGPALVAVAHRILADRTDRVHLEYGHEGETICFSLQTQYPHDSDAHIAPYDFMSLDFPYRRVRTTIGKQFLPRFNDFRPPTKESEVQILIYQSQFEPHSFQVRRRRGIGDFESLEPKQALAPFRKVYPIRHTKSPFHSDITFDLTLEQLALESEKARWTTPLSTKAENYPQLGIKYDGYNLPEVFGIMLKNLKLVLENHVELNENGMHIRT